MSFSLFFCKISSTGLVLLGLATNTLNTWKASNCMERDFLENQKKDTNSVWRGTEDTSRNRIIISLRFEDELIYFVIMLKLHLSSSNSPSNCKTENKIHKKDKDIAIPLEIVV